MSARCVPGGGSDRPWSLAELRREEKQKGEVKGQIPCRIE